VSWINSETFFALTFDQFEMVKVFAVRLFSLLALAAFAWAFLSGKSVLRRPRLGLLVVAFLGWVTLTTLTSVSPAQSVLGTYWRYEGLLTFLSYGLVFFLVTQLVYEPRHARSLAGTLVAAGSLVSAYAVIQFLRVELLVWVNWPVEEGRAFSTYGNPDQLAGFLIFPLILSVALALTEAGERKRFLLWAAASLSSVALLGTFVRGAWIAAFLSVTLLVFLARRLGLSPPKEDWAPIGLGLLLLFAAGVSTLVSTEEATNLAARTKALAKPDQGSVMTRRYIWQGAFGAIAERPVLGGGPDTFSLVFTPHEPAEYVRGAGRLNVPDNAHNYPLQIAATLGLPGLALLYGLFVAAGWLSIKRIAGGASRRGPVEETSRQGPSPVEKAGERMGMAGFWVAGLGYLLHLMFGLSVPSSSVLLWLSAGVVLSPMAAASSWRPPRAAAIAAAGVIVPVVSTALAASGLLVAADYYLRLGNMPSLAANAFANRRTAVSINPYSQEYTLQLAILHMEAFKEEAGRTSSSADRAGADRKEAAFRRAEAALADVIARNPRDFYPYLQLASLYNTAGRWLSIDYCRKAIEVARQGMRRAPVEPDLRYEIARARFVLGDEREALRLARSAVRDDPRHVYAYLLMAEVHGSRGRLLEAKRACQAAVRIDTGSLDPVAPIRLKATKAFISSIDSSLSARR